MTLQDWGKRLRRCWNFLRFGDQLRIDAASHCQLRCPVCQDWDLKARVGRGYLRFEDFRKFVDSYENFTQIELSNNGEMFLNPDLPQIIAYAHTKKIDLTAENGVNLNHVSDDTIDALVSYGFKSINVSIDGASDETYAIYRKRGNFSQVISNIRKINARKAALNSERPRLKWRFIVFGHNEHEISTARQMAESLGMQFQLLANAEADYSPIRNPELVAREMGYATLADWKATQLNQPSALWYCTGLWDRIQINWDGRLLGCCVNTQPFAHNVFETGLGRATRDPTYRRAKQALTGRGQPGVETICSDCGIYQQRIQQQAFVDGTQFLKSRWQRCKRRIPVMHSLGRMRRLFETAR